MATTIEPQLELDNNAYCDPIFIINKRYARAPENKHTLNTLFTKKENKMQPPPPLQYRTTFESTRNFGEKFLSLHVLPFEKRDATRATNDQASNKKKNFRNSSQRKKKKNTLKRTTPRGETPPRLISLGQLLLSLLLELRESSVVVSCV